MELQIVQDKIFEIRGCRVMLDFHLAEMYGVKTKVLKQAVKRNEKRFPPDFKFSMTNEEMKQLVTNCDQLPETLKHSYVLPDCYTELGVAMLSSVLRSDKAIEINIFIMRAFVYCRQIKLENNEIISRIQELEISTDAQFSEIYQALTELASKRVLEEKPRNPIGYRTNNSK